MLKLFISYSHKDEAWKDRVKSHLDVPQKQGFLEIWDDRQIRLGKVWRPEIDNQLTVLTKTIRQSARATPPRAGRVEPEPGNRDELPPVSMLPAKCYLPHRPLGDRFVGRAGDLRAVDDILREKGRVVVEGVGRVGVAVGMGGIGKTQLAIEYAHGSGRIIPAAFSGWTPSGGSKPLSPGCRKTPGSMWIRPPRSGSSSTGFGKNCSIPRLC